IVAFQRSAKFDAVRVAEPCRVAGSGGIDRNHDGDTNDIVMFAYDLKSRRAFSTVMAAKQCQVAGCDPGLPYKIRDGAVYFVTDEKDQNCSADPQSKFFSSDCISFNPSSSDKRGDRDLNGDGMVGVDLQIFGDADGDGVF